MGAEPARHRHRVDQPGKRVAAGQGEVIALGVIGGGHAAGSACRPGRAASFGACSPAEFTRLRQRSAIGSAPPTSMLDAGLRHPAAQHRGVEDEDGAGILGIALQRQHIGMAVDDAGRGREQRRGAVQRRLQRQRLVPRQQPVRSGTPLAAARAWMEPSWSASASSVGHDQLAAIGVRDAALGQ